MTTTFDHPRPVIPAHVQRRSDAFDELNRSLYRALSGHGADLDLVTRAELLVRASLAAPATDAERIAEARYDREVEAYNAAVDAHNAGIRARRQARLNAVEVRAVRAAACRRCTMTHAGEC